MSRRNTKSQAVVESLLDERRQYQEWLDKLALPGAAGAPSLVVERVRADYQSRLDNVTRQLARHEGELQTTRAEAELRRDLAAGQRTARQDALTEAVLRHEVGEFGDEKFAALSAEHTSSLAQLAEEIESADRDITRLEEVLGLIARVLPEPAPPPPTAPAAPTEPVARTVPVAPAAAPAPPPAAAPFAAAEAVGRVAAQLRGLDELSFLRSVAGAAKPGTVAPAGATAGAAEASAAPAPEAPLAAAVPPPQSPMSEQGRAPRVSRPVMPPAALGPPTPPASEPPAPAPPAPAAPAPAPPAPAPVAPAPRAPVPPAPDPRAAAPRAPAPLAAAPPARETAAPEPLESRRSPEPAVDLGAESRPAPVPNPRMGELPMPVHHIIPELPPESKSSARQSKKGFSAADAADDVARKSLRCTECGTLNLPTEWYCEKCGAELSAF